MNFKFLLKTGESTLYYDKELETLDPEKTEPEKLQYVLMLRLMTFIIEKNCTN